MCCRIIIFCYPAIHLFSPPWSMFPGVHDDSAIWKRTRITPCQGQKKHRAPSPAFNPLTFHVTWARIRGSRHPDLDSENRRSPDCHVAACGWDTASDRGTGSLSFPDLGPGGVWILVTVWCGIRRCCSTGTLGKQSIVLIYLPLSRSRLWAAPPAARMFVFRRVQTHGGVSRAGTARVHGKAFLTTRLLSDGQTAPGIARLL